MNGAPTPAHLRRLGPVLLLALLAACLLRSNALRADEEEPAQPVAHGATPEALEPYGRSDEPYYRFFQEPPRFRGPGAETPEPEGLTEVKLGVVLALAGPERERGESMRRGVTLALEEANARGGFRERLPYRALFRDENRPWGAAASTVVELAFEERVWALVGALEDGVSHVMARVLLKAELPMVNTGGTDPTLTEHAIPWLVRVRPDDRQIGYSLARRIFQQDRRRTVAIFRSNDRYGRTGTKELADAARRLRAPIPLEVRFENEDAQFKIPVLRLRSLKPDAIVLWGRAGPAGRALRALRAAGIDAPVYGPDRLVDPAFLAAAGAAAEGTVAAYAYDPSRGDEAWQTFRKAFRVRFGADPNDVAAHAYDGTRYLVDAIERAGLNRVRIREALFARPSFVGVTGSVRFDTTHNNVRPVVLGEVRDGAFQFR